MREKELDQILADMAEETPEMPADFHEKWTRAIREEAAAPKERETEEKRRKARTQWRRLAGMAAVMVFLVAGTLLTRGRWHPEGNRAGSVQEISREEALRPEEAGDAVMFAANGAVSNADTVPANGAFSNADAVPVKAAAKSAALGNEASEADMAAEAVYEAEEAYEADAAYEAAEATENEEETAVAAEPMRTAEAAATVEPMQTAETAATAEPMRTAETAATVEPTTGPREIDQDSEFVRFMKDMGRFIGMVWPYLAGAAVICLGAILIKRKK